LYRFIKVDGFANLTARVRRVILFIDGGALNLQEESFLVAAQKTDRFLGHLRQRRHGSVTFAVRGTGYRRLIDIAVVRRFRSFPANRHVAVGEKTQQRFALVGFADRGQRAGIGDNLVAAGNSLLMQRFALPFTGRRGFGECFRPPPKVTSARAFSSCSVIEPLPPFPARCQDIFRW
jgi:hypothetical protein